MPKSWYLSLQKKWSLLFTSIKSSVLYFQLSTPCYMETNSFGRCVYHYPAKLQKHQNRVNILRLIKLKLTTHRILLVNDYEILNHQMISSKNKNWCLSTSTKFWNGVYMHFRRLFLDCCSPFSMISAIPYPHDACGLWTCVLQCCECSFTSVVFFLVWNKIQINNEVFTFLV